MSELITRLPGIYDLYPTRPAANRSAFETRVQGLWSRFRKRRQVSPRQLQRFAERVDALGEPLSQLDDVDIGSRARQLRRDYRLRGVDDEFVAQAFALTREAADRTLGMRHYRQQLIGGWVMFNGMIAEMETGQGKTLTATLPIVAACLAGIPTHLITVNEYLAARDALELEPLYALLGLTVQVVTHDMSNEEKQAAYRSDVCYCTNKQVAFDHLRDRMKIGAQTSTMQLRFESLHLEEPRSTSLLLPGLCFAIVDEADSVLADEAVTPLIISANLPMQEKAATYRQALKFAGLLSKDLHYRIYEGINQVVLTQAGREQLESAGAAVGGLWVVSSTREELVLQAIRALHLFARDVEYLVKDGKIQIIDEFTGRVMEDRSWEQGLHQMIELKEGCEITPDRDTIARISYQRFFQRYINLAGMTGTGSEIQSELARVYNLPVVSIAPEQAVQRQYLSDAVYANDTEKWQAVLEEIVALHATGRPILVGTRTVEASENLAAMLDDKALPYQLLNARQDAQEAEIIGRAGEAGQITIATNMAGRGTDIKLSEDVVRVGGLHVIATERHESRRVDRQLFGRCARQGDPGSVLSILSLEDDIVAHNLPSSLLRYLHKTTNPRLITLLMRIAQLVVERRQYNSRKSVMKADKAFSGTLAFTGKME